MTDSAERIRETIKRNMITEEIVDKIILAIDESTMLGAGWDCLSTAAKDKFRKKLEAIVRRDNDQESSD